MKKKLLSAIILSALVLSLAGCGNKSTPDEPTSAESQNTVTADEITAAETQSITTADETTAEETTAPSETTKVTTATKAPKKFPKITSYKKFEGSDLLISDGNKKYVYNMAENKMYSIDPEISYDIDSVYGKLALIYDSANSRAYYYNLETKESYDAEALYRGKVKEYNAVYRYEEHFEGNVCYIGVIDSDGEWVLPLSSDLAICQEDLSYYLSCADICTGSLMSLDSYVVYDYKNDEIIGYDNSIGMYKFDKILGDKLLFNHSNKLLEYNTQTGAVSSIAEGSYIFSNAVGICRGALATYRDSALFFDNDGNLYDFDLSEYFKVDSLCDLTDKYIVFVAANENYDNYLIIANKDGNRVVEPIRGGNGSTKACIYDDYVVITSMGVNNDDKNQYIINCTTGETTAYTNIDDFDPESGKLIIKKGSEYYIADVSDPETLLNPFEIADE